MEYLFIVLAIVVICVIAVIRMGRKKTYNGNVGNITRNEDEDNTQQSNIKR